MKEIKFKKIADGAYDGSPYKDFSIDEQALLPKQKDSVAERLKLASKLNEAGFNTQLDARLHKLK